MSEPRSSPRPKKKKAKGAGHFLSWRLPPGISSSKKRPAFCLLLSLLRGLHHWPWLLQRHNPTRKMHLWVFELFELCFSILNQALLVPSSSSSHHHLLWVVIMYIIVCVCKHVWFQMYVRVLCTHSVMGKDQWWDSLPITQWWVKSFFWIGFWIVVEKLGVKIRKARLKYAKLTASSTQMGEKGLATLKTQREVVRSFCPPRSIRYFRHKVLSGGNVSAWQGFHRK